MCVWWLVAASWLTLWVSRRVPSTMDQRMSGAILVKEFRLTSHDAMNHLPVKKKGSP